MFGGRFVARYTFAVGAVLAAIGLRFLLVPLTGSGAPFVLFFAAIMVTGLVAGVGPAIWCLVVSLPVAAWLFVERGGHPPSQAFFQALLYGLDALIVICMSMRMRQREASLDTANRLMRRADNEHARTLDRTRETIELAPDAYFLADLNARYTYVNQAACNLLGYERDELIGMTIFDLIRNEDADRLLAERAELLTPGRVRKAEWMLKRKDGTLVPVEVSANIIPDGRWQAFVRDISEARRAADEREELLASERQVRRDLESVIDQLSEAEERFRLTIDEAPIGMALTGLDGRWWRVNRALCEITRYTADELTRLAFADITHPDDVETDLELAGQLRRGEIPRYQMAKRYIRKDGSIVHVMLSKSILRGADGEPRYYIAQVADVTERMRVERALQRAVESRDQVLGIVAHDLRNPLMTIMIEASLLMRSDDEERRDPTSRLAIRRSVERMTRLIDDLLDVASIEAGKLSIDGSPVSIAGALHEAIESQAPFAMSAGVRLELHTPPQLGDVWGDARRLHQVLDNLIRNATKFTPRGGRITVSATPREHDVLFSVADTGPGIPAEQLPRVFDRFWQATASARQLGAGLGLSITRGIVEAHGGQIRVESTPGHGSVFSFTIPRGPSDPRAVRDERSSERGGEQVIPIRVWDDGVRA